MGPWGIYAVVAPVQAGIFWRVEFRSEVMKNRILIVVALMVTIVLIPGWVPAQEENNDKLMPNPLAPFERLIGSQ